MSGLGSQSALVEVGDVGVGALDGGSDGGVCMHCGGRSMEGCIYCEILVTKLTKHETQCSKMIQPMKIYSSITLPQTVHQNTFQQSFAQFCQILELQEH